jgi:hypothetical protein
LSRLPKFLFLVFVFAVVESSTTGSVFAWHTGGSSWPTDGPCPGGDCHGQPVTLHYSFSNVFDGSLKDYNGVPLPNTLIRGSIEEALHVWTTAVNVNFVEVPDSGPAQLRFRHVYINGPDPPPPNPPIAKAQATCIGYGANCEVQYDHGDPWQENGTQSRPDLLGATIHEVGHILGLDHSDDSTANMYWIFHRFQQLGTGQLFSDDIAGVQFLYGAGTGSVTSLSSAPEPGSMALLFLAACGWFFRRPAR